VNHQSYQWTTRWPAPIEVVHAPEAIVAKLRQVEVLTGQGTFFEASHLVELEPAKLLPPTVVGRLGHPDRPDRIDHRRLEAENTRRRKAVADLTLEKLILKEAASGNW